MIPVIGHAGVGKTRLILKALKNWLTSSSPIDLGGVRGEPFDSRSDESYSRLSATAHYGQVEPNGKLKHPWTVELLELNIADLRPGEEIWPSGVRKVSAVVFCYDSTRRDSLNGLKDVIGEREKLDQSLQLTNTRASLESNTTHGHIRLQVGSGR